jgi:DNA polymerase III delta prime subunit
MAVKTIWFEKYRPQTLKDYVFHDAGQQAQIERWVRDIPHLLLCGTPGSGKTSLAGVLVNELGIDEMDYTCINASDKNGIDFIRENILAFAESWPMGKFKVIHLEEFDYMSQAAQGMLRMVMETNSETCRFICTCNFENKIIAPIKSRFQVLHFKAPNEDDVLVKMFTMLEAESVKFSDDDLLLYVKQAYPDIRKIINNLQQNTVDGKLMSPKSLGSSADWRFKVLDLLMALDIDGIRKLAVDNVPQEEVEALYEFLYRNYMLLDVCKADKKIADQAIVVIADGLRAHASSGIPHLTFEATCVKLMYALNG